MRVLIVKTSSMGDVLHTLPALTDAAQAIPGIRFDWVVEEGFAQIPSWHESVERVIPVAIRRWRKAFSTTLSRATRCWRRRNTPTSTAIWWCASPGTRRSLPLCRRIPRTILSPVPSIRCSPSGPLARRLAGLPCPAGRERQRRLPAFSECVNFHSK